jgi:DeoR/GlpR family transcriptional regulator of sugar metabolism
MNKADRMNAIMQTLQISKAASVQELSEQLKVSHMTVRRDLISLVL